MEEQDKIYIALADDHAMFREGLVSVLTQQPDIEVLFSVENGKEFLAEMKHVKPRPDVCILDISMPVMNGCDTVLELKKTYKGIKVLAVSMFNDEYNIIRMLRAGANGYITKVNKPQVLLDAIRKIHRFDFYYSHEVTPDIRHNARFMRQHDPALMNLTDKELELLKLSCTDMTYKEVAQHMNISLTTVNGHRERLFKKLKVRSRVGLVMYAIRYGIIETH